MQENAVEEVEGVKRAEAMSDWCQKENEHIIGLSSSLLLLLTELHATNLYPNNIELFRTSHWN